MGVPVFKGERAFQIFNEKLDVILDGLKAQTQLPDDQQQGIPWFIDEEYNAVSITQIEIDLLRDIQNSLSTHKDTGLTREIVYDTIFDKLPGVTIPNIDAARFERIGDKVGTMMGALFQGDNDHTLDESERDALRKVFNILAKPENNKFGVSAAAVKWTGDLVTKLDRIFSETWHTAWNEAHSGLEGAPRKEDVQGLESVFIPPQASRKPR